MSAALTEQEKVGTSPEIYDGIDISGEECLDCDGPLTFSGERDPDGYPVLVCIRCSHLFVFIPSETQ
jgi:hypothetical protein